MPDQSDAGYFTIPLLEYRFVEFVRIDTPADIELAAAAILGEDAGSGLFRSRFGIDLKDYKGYYIEVSHADAPRGPITPGEVGPVLTLRCSRSGQQFRPNVLKVQGFYDRERKYAWAEAEKWEELIGDDVAKTARARMREADARLGEWRNSPEAQEKRMEVLEELLGLVRDPGIGNDKP